MALSMQTKVQLGMVVTVCGSAIATAYYVGWSMGEARSELQQIRELIDSISANSYTKAEAAEVALRQAILNPGMRVPDPSDPKAVIVVEAGQ